MVTKHFLKILATFLGMIIIGLIGIYLVNYFDKGGELKDILNIETNTKTKVAK